MNNEVNPDMIVLARESRGQTQQDLAEKIKMLLRSKATIVLPKPTKMEILKRKFVPLKFHKKEVKQSALRKMNPTKR